MSLPQAVPFTHLTRYRAGHIRDRQLRSRSHRLSPQILCKLSVYDGMSIEFSFQVMNVLTGRIYLDAS